MKAMEISINGMKRCTTGVGDKGVLSTIVNWIGSPEHESGERSGFGIAAGGMTRDEKNRMEHFEWLNTELELGDEIIIRLIETDEADIPRSVRPEKIKRRETRIPF